MGSSTGSRCCTKAAPLGTQTDNTHSGCYGQHIIRLASETAATTGRKMDHHNVDRQCKDTHLKTSITLQIRYVNDQDVCVVYVAWFCFIDNILKR